MKIDRRVLLAAILPAMLIFAQPSRADDAATWDGTWNGMLGKVKPWPISITIAQGKVVNFMENGAAFDVKFTKITPTTVLFGDEDHYSMKLIKTGDTTASARVHGRHGFGHGSITKG